MIKTTKWRIYALNETPMILGLTLVLNSTRNGQTIDGKMKSLRGGCHGCVTCAHVRELKQEDDQVELVRSA